MDLSTKLAVWFQKQALDQQLLARLRQAYASVLVMRMRINTTGDKMM